MFLVLGLGNPEARYLATRHNVGFLVVDALARRGAVAFDREQLGALVAKSRVGSVPLVLAKPQQYMNRSGGPGQQLAHFYKVPTDHVVVVHDDMDIAFGDVRVKAGGGHGGHNGLRDLVGRFGTGDFVRVRVGVSRPPSGWDPADYVLGRWSDDESGRLEEVVATAADAVESIVSRGLIEAQNTFNARRAEGAPSRA